MFGTKEMCIVHNVGGRERITPLSIARLSFSPGKDAADDAIVPRHRMISVGRKSTRCRYSNRIDLDAEPFSLSKSKKPDAVLDAMLELISLRYCIPATEIKRLRQEVRIEARNVFD